VKNVSIEKIKRKKEIDSYSIKPKKKRRIISRNLMKGHPNKRRGRASRRVSRRGLEEDNDARGGRLEGEERIPLTKSQQLQKSYLAEHKVESQEVKRVKEG
jgi:hypothetical protein